MMFISFKTSLFYDVKTIRINTSYIFFVIRMKPKKEKKGYFSMISLQGLTLLASLSILKPKTQKKLTQPRKKQTRNIYRSWIRFLASGRSGTQVMQQKASSVLGVRGATGRRNLAVKAPEKLAEFGGKRSILCFLRVFR